MCVWGGGVGQKEGGLGSVQDADKGVQGVGGSSTANSRPRGGLHEGPHRTCRPGA